MVDCKSGTKKRRNFSMCVKTLIFIWKLLDSSAFRENNSAKASELLRVADNS